MAKSCITIYYSFTDMKPEKCVEWRFNGMTVSQDYWTALTFELLSNHTHRKRVERTWQHDGHDYRLEITERGSMFWYRNNLLHNEHGPAIAHTRPYYGEPSLEYWIHGRRIK